MNLLRHYTLGALFGFILVFSILSYWCVGLRVEVERTINYYVSSNEHNVIIINPDTDSEQIQEPLLLIPRQSFDYRRKRTHNNPYQRINVYEKNPGFRRNNFNVETSFKQHGFLFTERNYSRYKVCNNCFTINFDFLIENDICMKANFTLVYLVFTKYSNVAQRSALRKTWLSDVKTARNQTFIFVTGNGPKSDDFNMNTLIDENDKHKDILLVDFLDSYANLTYKTIMAFKWVTRRCPQTRFVMKVDDDVWVHKPPLMQTLRRKNFEFGGYCMFNSFPFRNKDSKYYASFESFPERLYPPFCSGTAYLTKIDIIQKILTMSPNVPFFHLEDVYMALCLRELHISVTAIRGFNAQKLMASSCMNKSPSVITSHGLGPNELKQIWRSRCNFERKVGKPEENRIRQLPNHRERVPGVKNYARINDNINKMIKRQQGLLPINKFKRHMGKQ